MACYNSKAQKEGSMNGSEFEGSSKEMKAKPSGATNSSTESKHRPMNKIYDLEDQDGEPPKKHVAHSAGGGSEKVRDGAVKRDGSCGRARIFAEIPMHGPKLVSSPWTSEIF